MSPKDEDEIRKLILERRARFLAAALTTTGLHACTVDTGPSVCLSIAATFEPRPTSTTTSTGTATATNASTSTTTNQVNSCRNPPACVCLSIAVSHPEIPPIAPPVTTTSETNASTLAPQDTSAPSIPADAGADGGSLDGGPDGGTSAEETSNATTGEISQALTEPTVCLSLLMKRK